MKTTSIPKQDYEISEESVAEYLQNNPDFFTQHEVLLSQLYLPHEAQGTVSLVERQITLLRSRCEKLESKLHLLVETARENEYLSLRIHRFAQALIEAETVEEVIQIASDQLRNDFQTEVVNIQGFSDVFDAVHSTVEREKVLEVFPRPFDSRRPYSGLLKAELCKLLFNHSGDTIKSAAVVPLFDTQAIGYLALGSTDENHFRPGMGLMFLGHLGELISTALSHHKRIARN